MKMADRAPSELSLEEPTDVAAPHHGQVSEHTHRRATSKSDIAGGSQHSSIDLDAGQAITKPSNAKLPPSNDSSDGQPSLRHTFPHLYHSSGTSRSPSTRTSSSSLKALNEDTVVDARSERSVFSRISLSRRTSYNHQSDSGAAEYPVYPDQSYAVLQSQIHPTYQPPFLRSRSSYPVDTVHKPTYSRGARTAGNTPISSPGLFSVRTPGLTSSPGSDGDDRSGNSYLHPSHLQPPKE